MSTTDDNTNDVSPEEAEETTEETPEESSQPDYDSSGDEEECHCSGPGLPILFFIIGFVAMLIFGWFIFPEFLYCKIKQPIDFNHVLHMEEVDKGCESCHFFREDGTFAGVPKNAQCIKCHAEVQGDDPDELEFVEKYISNGVEVPWLSYSRQPDCVFFSHAAHVKLANMDCAECHGPMGESTSLKVYEKNWLSQYSRDIWGKSVLNMLNMKQHTWERMKMYDCAVCHMEKTGRETSVQTAKDGCFVCHK